MASKEPLKRASQELTKADMVLVAMYRASSGSIRKMPYEDIVIKAWEEFPETFSLRNYPQHPDASDVHKRLYQNLVSKGLAVSLGSKIFRLTEKGLERAKLLTAQRTRPTRAVRRITRSEELILRHVKGSRAYATWAGGKAHELVDYDARLFFQFSSATSHDERRRRAAAVIAVLEKAKEAGAAEAQSLLDLAQHLRATFVNLFDESNGGL